MIQEKGQTNEQGNNEQDTSNPANEQPTNTGDHRETVDTEETEKNTRESGLGENQKD